MLDAFSVSSVLASSASSRTSVVTSLVKSRRRCGRAGRSCSRSMSHLLAGAPKRVGGRWLHPALRALEEAREEETAGERDADEEGGVSACHRLHVVDDRAQILV